MAEELKGNGGCLCGAVRMDAKNISKHVGACHCDTCRKWGGGPLLAVDCGTRVDIVGEENVTVYDSSEWAQRGFCSQCGTHLFYRLRENQQYILPAGLLDDNDGLRFKSQIFIDQKPSFYSFAEKTQDMTAAEVFAKFAAPTT